MSTGTCSTHQRPCVSNDNKVLLPFDVNQVLENLRYERYVGNGGKWLEAAWTKDAYYRLRPYLPVGLRKHFQRAYLRGWEARTFPSWPVDRSVDVLFERVMDLALRASGRDRFPFIWFWPEGSKACAILTHDIETKTGRDLTGQSDGYRRLVSASRRRSRLYLRKGTPFLTHFLDSIRDAWIRDQRAWP